MKKKILMLPLALCCLLLSGCATGDASSGTTLLEIGMSGGRCVDGSCGNSYTVHGDGSTDPQNELRVDVKSLEEAIGDSKLRTLAVNPEAFCQSFVDGQGITIKVTAWGDEVYKPCELSGGDKDPLALEAQRLFNELAKADVKP